MADYISREAALKDFESCNAENPNWTPTRVKTLLIRQPAADVAPVVRCKDCEHARDLGFQFGSLVHESWFCIYNGPHTTGANDFCSHGQKREKGEIEDDP